MEYFTNSTSSKSYIYTDSDSSISSSSSYRWVLEKEKIIRSCDGCVHQTSGMKYILEKGVEILEVCIKCYSWSNINEERKNYKKNPLSPYFMEKFIDEVFENEDL